ncbi:MAG TPA: helix-turn-helix domain-containing protein [Microlunatus sp.]
MGLREVKTARTRRRMTEVALELFLRDGFDQTTMEQIAEHAEVGTTTLYRYFPTKDQLLLDPLVEAIDPAPHLRDRPADEPLEVSLAAALLSAAAAFDGAGTRLAEMRRLVDTAPVARARLWDRVLTLREDLEAVIGDRMARDPGELSVRATAGLMLDLFHLVDRDADETRTREEVMAGLLSELPSSTVVIPTLSNPASIGHLR